MPGTLSPLGERIEKRRADLGMKLAEVADAAGLSIEVLRALRYGENEPRIITLAAIDRALQWKPGSAAAFTADGTEPVAAEALPPANRAAAAAVLFPDDPVAQAILAQEHKPEDQRRRELAKWLAGDQAQQALQFSRNEPGTICKIG
ncbi:MAG: helix-turn-helix domain-containing protein [Trebonia sp.]